MSAAVIFLLLLISSLVLFLLHYYANLKTFPFYISALCFICWVFPFSISVILPLDLSSKRYMNCLAQNATNTLQCDSPIGFVDTQFLMVFWRIVYWTMFFLTWFAIPIFISWVRSGEFILSNKFAASIRENLLYYTVLGSVGGVILLYIFIKGGYTTKTFFDFLMAASNAWGLLISTLLVGYGLVELPRSLWFQSDNNQQLIDCYYKAVKCKEEWMDSEYEVNEVCQAVFKASRLIENDSDLRVFINELLEMCPLTGNERTFIADSTNTPDVINQKYLNTLHARLKKALIVDERNQAIYKTLLFKAYLLQDIERDKSNEVRIFNSAFLPIKEDNLKAIKQSFFWWWYLHIKPILLKFISIISAFASIVIIWSESTFQLDISPSLSILALIVHDPNISNFILEMVSFFFITYICLCAFSTLFKIKVFDIYMIIPRHSDQASILWIGSYLCRLTFPLGYNLLNMTKDDNGSVFLEYLGKAVNLAPLLGENYNKWVPMMILFFGVLTFFGVHGRVLRFLGFNQVFYRAGGDEVECVEGRSLVERERGIEERKRSTNTYGTTRSSSPIQNTKDFLSRYIPSSTHSPTRHKSIDSDEWETSSRKKLLGFRQKNSVDDTAMDVLGEDAAKIPSSSRRFGNFNVQDEEIGKLPNGRKQPKDFFDY